MAFDVMHRVYFCVIFCTLCTVLSFVVMCCCVEFWLVMCWYVRTCPASRRSVLSSPIVPIVWSPNDAFCSGLAPDLPETWSLQCFEPVCWVQSLPLTRFVFVVFWPCHLPGTVPEAVIMQHFGTWLSNTAEWECAVVRHWVAKSQAYQPTNVYQFIFFFGSSLSLCNCVAQQSLELTVKGPTKVLVGF